ncbi:hypothetical protein GCM10009602_29520 [Nocardiopsis tropica]
MDGPGGAAPALVAHGIHGIHPVEGPVRGTAGRGVSRATDTRGPDHNRPFRVSRFRTPSGGITGSGWLVCENAWLRNMQETIETWHGNHALLASLTKPGDGA